MNDLSEGGVFSVVHLVSESYRPAGEPDSAHLRRHEPLAVYNSMFIRLRRPIPCTCGQSEPIQ